MSIVNPPPDPSDLDTIEYPSSDGQPMGETGIHVVAILQLFQALLNALPETAFIAADMFWYWERGHPESCVAPDVMVVKGRGRAFRRSYFTWREGGAVPSVVFEMASEGTWRDDLGRKRELYEGLGVREYLLFDPEGEYLPSRLMGYRLIGGRYEPIEPDRDGRLLSEELGLSLGSKGLMPRLFDAITGAAVPTFEVRAEQESRRAEQADQRAEQADQRAEQADQRAEQERVRADALGAEVERLRALLEQMRGAGGGGPSA